MLGLVVVLWFAIVLADVTLQGDAQGPVGSITVRKLQGQPVSAPSPSAANLLIYNGSTWNSDNPTNLTISSTLITQNITSGGAGQPTLVLPSQVPPDATLIYWVSYSAISGASSLGTYNVATGNFSALCNDTISAIALTDIAICPNGIIYVIDNSSSPILYSINTASCVLSVVCNGVTGFPGAVNSLACGSSGALHVSMYGNYYDIDTQACAAANATAIPGSPASAGDLTWYQPGNYYMGATGNALYFLNRTSLAWSYPVTSGSTAPVLGLSQQFYNYSTHLWGASGNAFFEIDPYSGNQGVAQSVTTVNGGTIQGTASYCWSTTATVLSLAGNLNMYGNNITNVRALYVDNLFSTGTFTETNAINFNNNLNMINGTNVTFAAPVGSYASGLTWTDTNLYRGATGLLQTDGSLYVRQGTTSQYYQSGSSIVANPIGVVATGLLQNSYLIGTAAIATVSVNASGSGYAVTNTLTVTGCSGANGQVSVTSVSGGGVITGLSVLRGGNNYVVGQNCTVTGGSGTGATINILTVASTTFTSATAIEAQAVSSVGSPVGSSVTEATAIQVAPNNVGSGPMSITTCIGIDVAAQTATATNNYGVRIAAPTGGTAVNNALQMADTSGTSAGGITFGADAAPQANLYRSAASTLRTDGRLRVASVVESTYEIVNNGNVTNAIGSVSGVTFTGVIPSINGLLTVTVGSGGTGYTAGDVLTVTGCSGTGGQVTATAVASGVITAITITAPGTGYTVTNGCATTGGTGTGALVNITSRGSTTITNAIGYRARAIDATGLFVTPAVTTATGVQITSPILGSGPVTVTTNVGVDIQAQTATAGYNYGVRIATPTGGTTVNKALNFISATTADGGITFGNDPAPQANLYRSTTSTVRSDGDIVARHFYSNSAAPAIAAGTGAGTSPTASVSGTDCRFTFTLTTGSAPASANNIATFTYTTAFALATNSPVFSPKNANAAALTGTKSPYILSEATTNFVFRAGSTALTAATQYIWTFAVC